MPIRRLLRVPPSTPLSLPGFHQVCLLFYNKYFILQAIVVFSISKETKFEVDTSTIIVSYSYRSRNVNKELFRYC